MECLGENTLSDLLQGLVSEPARAAIEEHTAACEACRRMLSRLVLETQNLRPRGHADGHGLAAGSRVGRYVIRREIAHGAMGTVFCAFDPELVRQVALKILHPGSDAQRDLIGDEARALARLSHENVVTVYDVEDRDGALVLAMELVDGCTLRDAAGAMRSAAAVLDAYRQAGRGLAAAHAAALVHRDFKPDNVLLGNDGRVRVVDFGLATAATGNDIAGTPSYMAPEQFGRGGASAATDQFAFCVSLFEALHGERPFQSNVAQEVARGPRRITPRFPVPAAVTSALERGLRASPEARFPSMTALLAQLAPRRRRWPLVAAAAAAMVVGGTAVYLARGGDTGASCASAAADRLAGAWSPALAGKLGERFARSNRPYAATMTARATAAFDLYGQRWEQLEADACTAERAAPTRLATLRRACLDERIAALRTLADVVTTDDRPEIVDHALDMIHGLPDVADCADAESLLAGPDAPPRELAARIAPISDALVIATAKFDAGDHDESALASIVTRARDAGWLPLALDARFALARLRLAKIEPVREELVAIASVATEHRLDRRAVRAWIEAVRAASTERSQPAITALAAIATASARRVGDPDLVIAAEVEHGAALGRIGQWDRTEAICRGALDEALAKLGAQARVTGDARDCVFRALVPLGKWDALAPLAAERIDTATRELGADHPKTIDYLSGLVYLRLHERKLAEARAIAERALDARRRASAEDLRVAEALYLVGSVELAASRPADARAHYRDALAIAERAPLDPLGIRARIHQGLAEVAHAAGDRAEELSQERVATELFRAVHGPDSIELAAALARYGQALTVDDFEAGVRALDEAHAIFERAGDRRALVVQAMGAAALVDHSQLARARPILERIVADPAYAQVFDEWNRNQVEHALARAKRRL